MKRSVTAYYFGCKALREDAGHALWNSDLMSPVPSAQLPPWSTGELDGPLAPKSTIREGAALLHHRDGWTALAFHDYTGDNRAGSNSAFVFHQQIDDLVTVLLRASAAFPLIVDRLTQAGVTIHLVAE